MPPTYEMHDNPAFLKSPLRYVSEGLGGVRQKIDADYRHNSFPIIEDLRKKGATDYVAMPLTFSDGQRNVLTLSTDAPGGFTTADLGLVFECAPAVSRFYEVFTLREKRPHPAGDLCGQAHGRKGARGPHPPRRGRRDRRRDHVLRPAQFHRAARAAGAGCLYQPPQRVLRSHLGHRARQ
ncbi:hypothetical protein ACFOHS_16160 [Jhaorihella thermophila]